MDRKEFNDKLQKEAKDINIELEIDEANKFYEYTKNLLQWNEKINLTSITKTQDIITKHYIDSLTIAKYISKGDKILDIGTGAGFPGIPIKIIKEKCEITLIDSLNKRINFLDEIIKVLKLEGINTIHSRAEELGQVKEHREAYDVVISRAVAPLNILLEYMMPFVNLNGICICMKGINFEKELEDSNNAIGILGGKLQEIEKFTLPDTDINRTLIIIKKIKSTPKMYPRKAGIPSKTPL